MAALLTGALLPALPAAAQCNPSIQDCGSTPGTGPDVGMTPDGGTYTLEGTTVRVPVTVVMTDADGLDAATRRFRLWNGSSSVAAGLSWSTNAGGTRGTASGTLDLSLAGDNILVAEVADLLGNPGSAQATFRLTVAETGLPVVNWDVHHSEFRNTGFGAFELGYAMPAYTSMGAARTTALVYNSEHASPTAFVQVDARPDPGTASNVVALSLRIEQWSPNSAGTQPLVGRESFYWKGDGTYQRLAVHWKLSDTPTGAYRFWAVVRAYADNGSYKERRQVVRVLVLNEKKSRHGVGWRMSGIQRLHSNGSDGLLLDEGNGIARFFKGVCSASCTYTTPAGDFTKLAYRGDSKTWARTYTDGSQVIFDSRGVMAAASDRFGNTTSYEWQMTQDAQPALVLTRIVDPVGHATTFGYDAGGFLRTMTAAGRTVTLAYNTVNQLTGISGPESLQLTYNAAHSLLGYTSTYGSGDPGFTAEMTYDDFRQLRTWKGPAVTVSGGAAEQPKVSYRSLPVKTAPSINFPNDFNNRSAPIQSAAVAVETTDARSHTTRTSLDRYGNPTKSVDPHGITTELTWSPDGLPEAVSTPISVTTYMWNSRGQLLLQTLNGNVVYEAAYNLQNQPEFELAGGSGTWYAYGPRAEVIRSWYGKKEDEQRTATTYHYNSRYQLIRATGPKGDRTEWAYEGNVWRNADYVRTTREDGTLVTATFTYDLAGRTRTVTNPLSQTVTFEYDPLNRRTRAIDAAGRSTVSEYTGGNLTRVVDPAGKAFEFTWNAMGWLLSEKFPGDPKPRTFTYNLDGLVVATTDRRDRTVSRLYDASHRLTDVTADGLTTTIRYPDAFTTVVTNVESTVTIALISGVGKLGSISSTLGGRRFEIQRIRDADNGWRDLGFDLRTYANEVLQRTDAVRYQVNHHPTDLSLGGTYAIQDVTGRTTTMSFDTGGRPVRTAFPNGVTQFQTFTTDGRLDATTFSSSAVNQKLGATFAYDALSRLAARTSILEDRQWGYGYDQLGQVIEYGAYRIGLENGCNPSIEECPPTWIPTRLEEYRYDAAGNRTDRGASVAAGTNRYLTFDGFSFEYDAEGNLTRKYKAGFEQIYGWNSLGQLTTVTTNGTAVSYGYDGLGRRVRRTAGGQTRHFLYDGDDLLLETEYDGTPFRMYTHWPGIDNPHSVRVTSAGQDFVYYYTMEHPGNVTGLLNTLGAVAGEYHYTPFGAIESESSSSGQPLKFMGRELDSSTGLYYVRNRWYDPAAARFVSQDPIGVDGGLNPYAYVGNDPMNQRDPSGLCCDRNNPYVLPVVVVTAYRQLAPLVFGFGRQNALGLGPMATFAQLAGDGPPEYDTPDRPVFYPHSSKEEAPRQAVDCIVNAFEAEVQAGAFAGGGLQLGILGLSGYVDGISTHGTLKEGKSVYTTTRGIYGDVTVGFFTIPLGWKTEVNQLTGEVTTLRGIGGIEMKAPIGGGGGVGLGGSATFNVGSWFTCWLAAGKR